MKTILKKTSLIILLTCLSHFGYSQIVNIPDNEFKQALINYSPRIDTNFNNEIEVSEALAVTSLTIINHRYSLTSASVWDPISMSWIPGPPVYGINDFTGIEAFVNLTYLDCRANDLHTLDVSALTQLTYLDCAVNKNSESTPYTTGISTLVLPASTTLKTLKCSTNKIAGSLNLSSYTNLEVLETSSNLITTLSLPNSNTLQNLNISYNQITSLNLTPYTALTNLNCNFNNLTTLDLTSNILLANLNCRNNHITSLDVTHQTTSLSKLICNNNNLSSLKMKNGNNTAITSSNFDARGNYNLTLICVDNITYASSNFNNIDGQMYFTDICSFIPTGVNTIKGTITYDFDANGCDAADFKSINTKIATVGPNVSTLTFTNNLGAYTLYTPDLTSTTAITPNFPAFFTVSPNSQTSTFTGTGNTETINYCITANSLVEDVSINVLPFREARPGFQTAVRILYENKGSAIIGGSFNFTYQDNKQTYNSSSVSPATQVGNVLTWNFTNLLPFESRYVDVFLTTNTPIDPINPVNNGEILNYTGNITTTTGDSDLSNNTGFVSDRTVGSHDPNDSVFLEGEYITAEQAEDYLHVRIRFQNTGTASAINVRVQTLLDADLNWDTFEPITASHNYVTTVTEGNKVNFTFENIYLPDSTTDDAGSNGWVYFKIKPKSTFALGDVADNSASIFFDYNAPVVTNTATTQIAAPLSVSGKNAVSFTIYPNPTKDRITIKNLKNISKIEIYDASGKLIGTEKAINNQINMEKYIVGIYILKISADGKTYTSKVFKN